MQPLYENQINVAWRCTNTLLWKEEINLKQIYQNVLSGNSLDISCYTINCRSYIHVNLPRLKLVIKDLTLWNTLIRYNIMSYSQAKQIVKHLKLLYKQPVALIPLSYYFSVYYYFNVIKWLYCIKDFQSFPL